MSYFLPKALHFLAALQENNHKDWFEAYRPEYLQLREQWIEFLIECHAAISTFDTDIAVMHAKDAVFRINRDVRFSKDKSPYKTHFGAYFARGGRQSEWAGYYLHIAPEACFFGGGAYQPTNTALKRIRQEIDYNSEEFLGIITHPTFQAYFGEIQGDALKTTPKDYPKAHPLANYLRLKGFFVTHILHHTNEMVALKNEIVTGAKVLYPFNAFLNSAMEG